MAQRKGRGKRLEGRGRTPGSRPQGPCPPRSPRPARRGPPRAARAPEFVGPEEMGRLLRKHEFELTPRQLELLTHFHRFLLEKNRQLNLTRILNLEDIVVKHYVDCFMVSRLLPALPEPLLDIGTGGGFPGIPLKILFPEMHIILGEGVRKRVNFLREAREELGMSKLDIIGRNIDTDFEYPVYGTITRAVAPIRDTLKRVRSCLMPGGLAVFMKGPNVDEEKREAGQLSSLYEEVDDIAYELPGTAYRRRLVVYRKLARE